MTKNRTSYDVYQKGTLKKIKINASDFKKITIEYLLKKCFKTEKEILLTDYYVHGCYKVCDFSIINDIGEEHNLILIFEKS